MEDRYEELPIVDGTDIDSVIVGHLVAPISEQTLEAIQNTLEDIRDVLEVSIIDEGELSHTIECLENYIKDKRKDEVSVYRSKNGCNCCDTTGDVTTFVHENVGFTVNICDECLAKAPAQTVNIDIREGLIDGLLVPKNVEVNIRDYDVYDEEAEGVKHDENGVPYTESIYSNHL